MKTILRFKSIRVLLLLLLMIGSTIAINAQEEAWELMKIEAHGEMSCVSDTLIYTLAGGGVGMKIGNETWCYNTKSNSWEQLADMPIAMTEGGIGQIGDKIYLVAGWQNVSESDDGWVTIDSILEYDIETNTFAFKKKAPLKIGSSISCTMNDELYLFGGMEAIGDFHSYEAMTYDPIDETWDMVSIPDMLNPHLLHGSAVVLDGKIYVLGGMGPFFGQQPSEMYDGEKWETIATMPVPVLLHKSIVHDNKILLFGGDDEWSTETGSSTNLVQEYDPATDSWRLMEPMPFNRSILLGGKVGNYVFLSGGYTDDRDMNSRVAETWRFDLEAMQEWCSEVTITENSPWLKIGTTDTIQVSVEPEEFSNKEIIWTSDNEEAATIENGIITAVGEGTATITAALKYGGCSASYTLNVPPVSVHEIELDQLSLYPNPCAEQLNVSLKNSLVHSIEISTLTGQLVYSDIVDRSQYSIDLASFKSGIYFVTFRSKKYTRTEKIIKL